MTDNPVEDQKSQLDTAERDRESELADPQHTPPKRTLHALRMGDGPSIPDIEPPTLWPELGALEPYWDAFVGFALDELDGNKEFQLRLKGNGKWRFWAFESPDRAAGNRSHLVYDPEEDTIEFSDPEVNSGWVMEDAFGNRPLDEHEREEI